MLVFLLIGAVTAVSSYVGVWLIRQWAIRRQILDVPNERSSHEQPTPIGGGLAIVVITAVIWLAASWYLQIDSWLQIILPLLGACMIAAVGWVDDMQPLSSKIRFGVHILAAVFAIVSFGAWDQIAIPFGGTVSLSWLGYIVTFFWLVGLTNAYNFMDGIDGLAGGQGVVAGLGWLILGQLIGNDLVSVLGLGLAAANLGFLGHNWPPARIFMGDVGSGYLGYLFALLPMMVLNDAYPSLIPGALCLWPFIFDTGFTFCRRLIKRENVFAAHRSHLYQRLVINGYSHRFVTLLYIGLALIGVILGIGWVLEIQGIVWITFLVMPLLCLGLYFFVVGQEKRLLNHD
ncbi:MAG: glycosyltransferase family 4 protein [Anaerolineae bacterium]|nr:glycosyltransferase family 4 protein [Anaerolineae bacterium]